MVIKLIKELLRPLWTPPYLPYVVEKKQLSNPIRGWYAFEQTSAVSLTIAVIIVQTNGIPYPMATNIRYRKSLACSPLKLEGEIHENTYCMIN